MYLPGWMYQLFHEVWFPVRTFDICDWPPPCLDHVKTTILLLLRLASNCTGMMNIIIIRLA